MFMCLILKGKKVCPVVNSWVEKETDGLITELLDPESVSNSSSRLIIANALCFKGVWKHKFDASMTYNRVFYLLNGTSIRVPFMSNMKAEQFVSVFDDLKVLRLSYKQGRDKKRQFSMYIFLPEAEDGLPALIEKAASEPGFLEDKLPKRKVKVRVFMIPKFKISFMLEASNVLKELGVVLPFSRCDANFTNMVDSPSDELYIDNMFHKAFIEVNEEGTEAAAASSGRLVRMCDSDSVSTGPDFVADHPFLFLIKEDLSGTILFIGRVLHPDEVDTLEDEDENDTLDEDEDDTVEDEDDDNIY
ncbi:serpin-ZXA-like [Lotus japonicus]|uniref:serpin-ZXA-like n=1 Tax=Lotus japonicus TaxID=34305 RepID=UPI0025845D04|nr:serpin-ZXA-like [Lotus japonicus]